MVKKKQKKFIILICVFISVVIIVVAALLYREIKHRRAVQLMFSESYNSQAGETSNPDVIQANVKLNHALIIFTFDDGNESDYSLAYPILQKYGIKGTSFINPYNSDHHITNKLSWNEIKQMYATGWEFQDHTYTHIALGNLSADKIKRSMEMVDYSFKRNGIKVPDTIAYPYGDLSQESVNVIKQYRKQARLAAVTNGIFFFNYIDPYRIQCVSADMQTTSELRNLEWIVYEACAEKVAVVFRVHCLYQDKLNDMGSQPVQTSSKLFAQLVDYCVKKGCEFTTMDGLMKLYTENK